MKQGGELWLIAVEHKLKSLSGVRDAMVVGSDRHQAALLVIPNGHLDVGPLLDDLNTNAPKHLQIVSELVKILPEDSTFVLSDKGSIKRAKSIAKYEGEIEALFAAYEGAGGEGGNVTSLKEAETLVDNVLQTVFRRDYATGDDFFDLGMDSLVAIRIRNAIQRRVNFALSSNVVFEHPSAHDLAEHIWHLAQGILGNSVSSSSTQAASGIGVQGKGCGCLPEIPQRWSHPICTSHRGDGIAGSAYSSSTRWQENSGVLPLPSWRRR